MGESGRMGEEEEGERRGGELFSSYYWGNFYFVRNSEKNCSHSFENGKCESSYSLFLSRQSISQGLSLSLSLSPLSYLFLSFTLFLLSVSPIHSIIRVAPGFRNLF